jgi:hypothetical protein
MARLESSEHILPETIIAMIPAKYVSQVRTIRHRAFLAPLETLVDEVIFDERKKKEVQSHRTSPRLNSNEHKSRVETAFINLVVGSPVAEGLHLRYLTSDCRKYKQSKPVRFGPGPYGPNPVAVWKCPMAFM